MVNSDVVIGWISDEGNAFFDDRYAIQYSEPIKDVNLIPPGENNVQLISLTNTDGYVAPFHVLIPANIL